MPSPPQESNPMHGVTLERILNELVAHYGWNAMGQTIDIRCFTSDPSVASSLKFLRRTPWARHKVERMYGDLLRVRARQPAVPSAVEALQPGEPVHPPQPLAPEAPTAPSDASLRDA